MDEPLPQNDRDALLARRIGDLLERRAPVSASALGEDPFHRMLDDYRHAVPAVPVDSDGLWASISAQTAPARTGPQMFIFRTEYRWMVAAAAVLIALGLLWMVMSRGGSTALVASAGAEMAVYTAPDGSSVTLRPHSRLYEVHASGAERYFQLAGEAFFDVVPAERDFRVSSNGALVTVLGTQFNVSTWGGKTQVYVEEGRVQLEHRRTGEHIELGARQWAALADGGFIVDAEAPARDEVLDWMNRELVFSARPLGLVLAELEHHFNIQVELPEALRREQVTGRVYLDSAEQSLADISMVIGGRFVQDHRGRFTYRSDE